MAKAIMVQGTMSNAGKSLVTAGLCRVFHQDGKKACPFKSQNMALNSFITAEGAEMGRAQVVQAEAAGKEVMSQPEITIHINLARGDAEDTVYTCDLSYDYVKINADYRS